MYELGSVVEVWSSTDGGQWLFGKVIDVDKDALRVIIGYNTRDGTPCRKEMKTSSKRLRRRMSSIKDNLEAKKTSYDSCAEFTQAIALDMLLAEHKAMDSYYSDELLMPEALWKQLIEPSLLHRSQVERSSLHFSNEDRAAVSMLYWPAWFVEPLEPAVFSCFNAKFKARRLTSGASASSVFVVSSVERGYKLTSVVKLGPYDEIERELINAKVATRHFQSLAPAVEASARRGERGAIRFSVASHCHDQLPNELLDAFADASDDKLHLALEIIFQHVPAAKKISGGTPSDVYAHWRRRHNSDVLTQGEALSLLAYHKLGTLFNRIFGHCEELFGYGLQEDIDFEAEVPFSHGSCAPLGVLFQFLIQARLQEPRSKRTGRQASSHQGTNIMAVVAKLTQMDAHWSYTHGDLHCSNVLLDGRGNCFIIDFASYGLGHAVEDLAKLEVSTFLWATPFDAEDVEDWLRQALLVARALARWGSPPRQHEEPMGVQSRGLRKFWRFAVLARRLARTSIGYYSDDELRVPLLRYSASMALWTHEKSCDARRRLAVAYAAYLAEAMVEGAHVVADRSSGSDFSTRSGGSQAGSQAC
eukprot:TRINITY_DN13563_c0_g1_i1.p1 TRINITY_DN13563_c0_g1~~TRINITY_DN13563_c0_g1_i1.p1  ORF type:complete len:588 (+),score=102.64 TRINITY_DN13563_c0_g1_i1:388-2151(+)